LPEHSFHPLGAGTPLTVGGGNVTPELMMQPTSAMAYVYLNNYRNFAWAYDDLMMILISLVVWLSPNQKTIYMLY
jgi:hypothetical protein